MFKVILDEDEVIENVKSWYMQGDALILSMQDGSTRGIRGFVNFVIELVHDNA